MLMSILIFQIGNVGGRVRGIPRLARATTTLVAARQRGEDPENRDSAADEDGDLEGMQKGRLERLKLSCRERMSAAAQDASSGSTAEDGEERPGERDAGALANGAARRHHAGCHPRDDAAAPSR